MTSSEIENIFNSFNKLKVLVIGDVMIDAYVWGKVNRISPEAPVPVVAVTKKENRLGGAANVALNLQALGAIPILCSVIGEDNDAIIFEDLLKKNKLPNTGIVKSKNRITTTKTRIIGNNHQMLRVDEEIENEISANDTESLFKKIEQLAKKEKVSVIIFEDYDKGVINSSLINQVVDFAKKNNIKTIVDPKKKNFLNYKRVTLLKPNLKELQEGTKRDFDIENKKDFFEKIQSFRKNQDIEITLITLSEHGMFISSNKENLLIPAHLRNIADVSGAGDTVVSVAALCLALNLPEKTIASLSNIAGGLVCEKVGVVPIDKKQFLKEAIALA